jgi:hypothetical protein
VPFLRVLLRTVRGKLRGKLLVIWAAGDGSPIHRGQPVKDFLRAGAARRLHLEQVPGYAPELNPAEGIWNYLRQNLDNQDGVRYSDEWRSPVDLLSAGKDLSEPLNYLGA